MNIVVYPKKERGLEEKRETDGMFFKIYLYLVTITTTKVPL